VVHPGWKCTDCSISRAKDRIQSLRKSLGDSVCEHPIKNTELRLCKLATPPMMPLTAQRETSLAVKGAIIVLFYLRYSFAVISLTTGWPWSTVCNFVARATRHQSLELSPHSGRPCILTQQQQRSIMWAVKKDRQITRAELHDMYAPNVSLSTINRYLQQKF